VDSVSGLAFLKVGYGYRVMRDGWAVGRLVACPVGWSVQDDSGHEWYAIADLAGAKRCARNLPVRVA